MRKRGRKGGTTEGGILWILGHPLDHTLSPPMQNAALSYLGIPWRYIPLDLSPSQLPAVVEWFRAPGIGGGNVTLPYKEKVGAFLDGLEPEARRLGSVNTLYRKGRRLWGASTDGEGFLRSLGRLRTRLPGSQGILLGAGGAAKAVAAALADSGIRHLFVANRSPQRGRRLVAWIRNIRRSLPAEVLSLKEAERVLPSCDWAVQATSVGLKEGDPPPIPLRALRPSGWVVDLIYHRRTAFLTQAHRRHLMNLDGTGMLLHQGALAFERWTGRKAPLEIMRKALARALRDRVRADNR